MFRIALVGVIAAAIITPAATAAPQAWVPGSNVLVSESDLTDTLETKFDRAYCDGIPRFGHSGRFPYEKFVVFDCSITLDGQTCFDWRIKTIKSATRGNFRVKTIRQSETCG